MIEWDTEMGHELTARTVGFVGVRGGLTYGQFRSLARLLIDRDIPGSVTGVEVVLHGADGWGDADFDRIARWMEPVPQFRVHEGLATGASPPASRNRTIVDGSDLLLACPPVPVEEPRSRTWMAVRYARRVGRPVVLVYPDGTVDPGARSAFLVLDTSPSQPVSVFLNRAPRGNGLAHPVVSVLLETLPQSNRAGGSGTVTARPCLGRSTTGPLRYREFPSHKSLQRAGFMPVGPYRVCDSWSDYHDPWPAHSPSDLEQTSSPLMQGETEPVAIASTDDRRNESGDVSEVFRAI